MSFLLHARLHLASWTAATAVGVMLVSAGPALGATPEQVATARAKALAWLLTRQASDGSWRSAPGAEVATTSTAIEALANARLQSYSYVAAVSWLSNATIVSVDSLARRISALSRAGVSATADLETLARWNNRRTPVRAWGAYERFETSFPDTPLALIALIDEGSTALSLPDGSDDAGWAVRAIVTSQTIAPGADYGSWAYIPAASAPSTLTASGAIVPTVYSALVLELFQRAKNVYGIGFQYEPGGPIYWLVDITNRAIDWLLTQKRRADGGFGQDGASTVFDTALVYDLLRTVRPAAAETTATLDFLLARQNADGSWNGEALQTAMVLRALPPLATALTDSDNDAIPDEVEQVLGTNPQVADSRWLARTSVNPAPSAAVPPQLAPSHAVAAVVLEAPLGDGDLNLDGVVDAADIAIAERIALGQVTPTADHLSHGDIAPAGARDGVIDVADVARIRRRVLRLEGP